MSHVWLNGRLVPADEARVSVLDRGFLLGDALFETMRAYDGRVFRLDAHLERLEQSAARIGIPLPGGLDDAVAETIRANALDEAAVRLTVTRGPGSGLEPPESPEPTVVIAVRKAPGPPSAVRAALAKSRRNEHSASAGLKHPAYLDAVVEITAARRAGCDDVIFLDTEGHLSEGAYSNLFLVAAGALHTPPPTCGALPGITRATVLEMAPRLGLQATEEALEVDALSGATEAFLTSSLREIVPLIAVEGRRIGPGEPGDVTRRIQQAYATLTRRHT